MSETDNSWFINENNFGSLNTHNFFYSEEENISKQTKKEGKNSQELKIESIALDDLESELLDLSEEKLLEINFGILEISRQSE